MVGAAKHRLDIGRDPRVVRQSRSCVSSRRLVSALIWSVIALSPVAVVAGCGGSAGSPVVGEVAGSPITRGELSHWMGELAGGEFWEMSHGHTVPAGLVSDPPDYGGCVARLEAVSTPPAGSSKPTSAELLTKCRELYQDLKEQAMELLVDYHWTIGVLAEQGVHVTGTEVDQELARLSSETFSEGARLSGFLAARRRTVSDVRFLLMLDLLQRKALAKIQTGGKAEVTKLTEAEQRWTTKTSCQAGYVVTHCKQRSSVPSRSAPPSNVVLEQLAVVTGVPCSNRPACG
jgi:hypothetical protein